MQFTKSLISGRLERRYKRFMADVRLDKSGEVVTAHCANPGAMTGLKEPGTRVWLSRSNNPKRKLQYSWEMAEIANKLVGINTAHPNNIVHEAIEAGSIESLRGYDCIRREVKYGEGSRIDILLEAKDRRPCYVEVKNVHLMRKPGLAEFPDSVTARGTKHLRELAGMVESGNRAVMFYLVQRSDAEKFSLACDVDPSYCAEFATARKAGVEVISYDCQLSATAINIGQPLELTVEPQ
jgi:sugar fermentation stimulation protein A